MLLAYAAYANPDGSSIYPSKPTIAHDTRFGLSTVKAATGDLIDAGYLTVDEENPTKRKFGEGPRAWTRLYRLDYSSLGLAAENTANDVQEIPVVKAEEVQEPANEVQLLTPRSPAPDPNLSSYQSIYQSSSTSEEEEPINLEIEEEAEQIAKERLEATTSKVTNRRAWIDAVKIKQDVIDEARERVKVKQHRIEHADCDRCEGAAWRNCQGAYTEAELATRDKERQAVIDAAAEERETQAAEVRALAAGWHGYRALPGKPDTCHSCGETFDAEIHNVEAMAAA